MVKDCDRSMIADILAGHYDPGSVLNSDKQLDDVPTVEQRFPEISASAFLWGRQP